MPADASYPGVDIDEISSGVHTIVGVATSITAFLGQAAQGPTDRAVTVFGYSDFTRQFGDLEVTYPMTSAVRDFFLNGGSQGVIVRLYNPPTGATKPSAALKAGKDHQIELIASSPGDWANGLQTRVDHDVDEEVATTLGIAKTDLFNLQVRLTPDGPTEQFFNVTVIDTARRVDRMLTTESSLVRIVDPTTLEKTVPGASGEDATHAPVWETVQAADKGHPGVALVAESYAGDRTTGKGKYLLEDVDLFNLVCVLGNSFDDDVDKGTYSDLLAYCVERRAFLLVDPPTSWKHSGLVSDPSGKLTDLNLSGPNARNAAIYYPRLKQQNPLHDNQVEEFSPCGALAGLIAHTDANRGVWKAPAGIDVALSGVVGLADSLTDRETGVLNQVGINALRTFPVYGHVVWGARTLRGADRIADEYKYVPVRRTALFLEESLYRGLQWVVFEPNDEPLWAQIRLKVGAFLQSLFRQGAFQGKTPAEAYFVKCDKETTTQDDITEGIVHIVVGFAPLKPAEFVIVQLQQMAGQSAP